MNILRNEPPGSATEVPNYFVADNEPFVLNIDASLVDPEGYDVTITDVEIEGAPPTFMVLENTPSIHLRGFTAQPDKDRYVVTVKGRDNLN